jgi:hypothetical protein
MEKVILKRGGTKQESIDTLNEFLIEFGCETMSERDLIDWDIRGGESTSQLRQWARDIASEEATERAANKNAWRYEI